MENYRTNEFILVLYVNFEKLANHLQKNAVDNEYNKLVEKIDSQTYFIYSLHYKNLSENLLCHLCGFLTTKMYLSLKCGKYICLYCTGNHNDNGFSHKTQMKKCDYCIIIETNKVTSEVTEINKNYKNYNDLKFLCSYALHGCNYCEDITKMHDHISNCNFRYRVDWNRIIPESLIVNLNNLSKLKIFNQSSFEKDNLGDMEFKVINFDSKNLNLSLYNCHSCIKVIKTVPYMMSCCKKIACIECGVMKKCCNINNEKVNSLPTNISCYNFFLFYFEQVIKCCRCGYIGSWIEMKYQHNKKNCPFFAYKKLANIQSKDVSNQFDSQFLCNIKSNNLFNLEMINSMKYDFLKYSTKEANDIKDNFNLRCALIFNEELIILGDNLGNISGKLIKSSLISKKNEDLWKYKISNAPISCLIKYKINFILISDKSYESAVFLFSIYNNSVTPIKKFITEINQIYSLIIYDFKYVFCGMKNGNITIFDLIEELEEMSITPTNLSENNSISESSMISKNAEFIFDPNKIYDSDKILEILSKKPRNVLEFQMHNRSTITHLLELSNGEILVMQAYNTMSLISFNNNSVENYIFTFKNDGNKINSINEIKINQHIWINENGLIKDELIKYCNKRTEINLEYFGEEYCRDSLNCNKKRTYLVTCNNIGQIHIWCSHLKVPFIKLEFYEEINNVIYCPQINHFILISNNRVIIIEKRIESLAIKYDIALSLSYDFSGYIEDVNQLILISSNEIKNYKLNMY